MAVDTRATTPGDRLEAIAAGVIVQGLTGRTGRRHAARMRDYGTPIVAGVVPGRGGEDVDGVPVFDTIDAAVAATGAQASVAFLPPAQAPDGIVEAAEAGLRLCVSVTEGLALHDSLRCVDVAARNGMTIVGPNSPGMVVPGRYMLGFLPADRTTPGRVGVISRSGTLSYEVIWALTRAGIGQSIWIGIGGDRVRGTSAAEAIAFARDETETDAVVLLGEIGGSEEERVAPLLADSGLPVAALIVGRFAPPAIKMGHAGAIVQGDYGSYRSKVDALTAAGAEIAARPSDVARALRAAGFRD